MRREVSDWVKVLLHGNVKCLCACNNLCDVIVARQLRTFTTGRLRIVGIQQAKSSKSTPEIHKVLGQGEIHHARRQAQFRTTHLHRSLSSIGSISYGAPSSEHKSRVCQGPLCTGTREEMGPEAGMD